MALLNAEDRGFLRAVSKLAYSNPFLSERIEFEREALGGDYREAEPVWSMRVSDPDSPQPNLVRITDRLETSIQRLRGLLVDGAAATDEELDIYEAGALFLLYQRYEDELYRNVVGQLGEGSSGGFEHYTEFLRDWRHLLHIDRVEQRLKYDAAHLFACFFQLRRAFHLIFRHIIGSSMAAARLRASAWQSIFTHDMLRYRETLYDRMGDITTLIAGPSGTGKELVARAIGLSRYVPFDPRKRVFSGDFSSSFHALNLSALPSTLIESELFGHRRGAFTGALQDRRGWLDACEAWGTVFLDEVGDLDPAIQVKLLRVLQTRVFQPLGDIRDQRFQGKIIAATNRNLDQAMRSGEFREDLYYRLCSDVIVTPSLGEQLRESPEVLRELLLFIARAVAGPEAEALAEEAEAWVRKHLSEDYPWPGNIRELEQCVRSVLIRKEYRPPRSPSPSVREEMARAFADGTLDAEQLSRQYCTLVYWQTGNYEEAARRLGLDRRTVKKNVDLELLAKMQK